MRFSGLLLLVALGVPGTAVAVEVPAPDLTGMEEDVVRLLEEARRAVLEQESATAWGALGAACHAHGLYPEAQQSYRQATALEPDEFRWIYLLAVVREIVPPLEGDRPISGEIEAVSRLIEDGILLREAEASVGRLR